MLYKRAAYILDVKKLIFSSLDVGHVHVVGLRESPVSFSGSQDGDNRSSRTEGEISSSFLPVKIYKDNQPRLCHGEEGTAHVGSNKMDFGVTVLSRLGSRHVDDFARSPLDHNVSVLPEGGTLHTATEISGHVHLVLAGTSSSREGLGGSGSSGLESVMVLFFSHFCEVSFDQLELQRGASRGVTGSDSLNQIYSWDSDTNANERLRDELLSCKEYKDKESAV